MQACGCLHPPAGATTLVVAACALVLHRLRGVDYPVWSPRAPSPDRDFTDS